MSLRDSILLSIWLQRLTEPVTKLLGIPNTTLTEYRLCSPVKVIVKSIIKYFYDLFEEERVPASFITTHDIYVRRNVSVVVPQVGTKPMTTTNLRNDALSNLQNILISIIGENVPKDISHLFCCIQSDIIENTGATKNIVLHHASLNACSPMTALLHLYTLYAYHYDHNTPQFSAFVDITKQIPGYKNWYNNLMSSLQHNISWRESLNEFVPIMGAKFGNVDYDLMVEPVGVLLFIRSSMFHHYKHDGNKSMSTIENELHVMFPLFMAHIMKNMILSGEHIFEDVWRM